MNNITAVKNRDDYGRSNTTFYVNDNVPAANIVKVPRSSTYIVTDWHKSDKNKTQSFSERRHAVAYAHSLCEQVLKSLNANTDEDGYEFCPDGECGACDNTGLACSNPVNPETGWAF